jgi:uncharacterized protein involved in exopolysaccharide biosynthesis
MNDVVMPHPQAGSVNVRMVLAQLLRHRWWILAAVLISTFLFTAVARWMTPIYRATVVMIPVSSERSNLAGSVGQSLGQVGSGLASLAGLNVGSSDPETQEALGVLRSRQFGEQFITDENLLPVIYAANWDSSTQSWKPGKRVPTLNKAFNYFNKKIRTVNADQKSGLTTLQIDWRDRTAAAAWANELLKRLNSVMRTRAITNADASIVFLEKELRTTSVVEMRDAINRLIETQEKQRMLANVTEEYAFRVVDPAVAPDADDPSRPPKFLLEVAGPIVGLLLAVAAVLMLSPAGSGGGTAPGLRRSSI